MTPAALRQKLGMSVARAAEEAGVARVTLRFYEASPENVRRADKREACRAFYARLERAMQALQAAT